MPRSVTALHLIRRRGHVENTLRPNVGRWLRASRTRPGIERVRQLFGQGFADVVLSYAVDRLSRNQIHIAVLLDDIEKVGATLEFVTENFENTPVGRLILNVRAFAGEVEREKIAKRTDAGEARAGQGWEATAGNWKGYLGVSV